MLAAINAISMFVLLHSRVKRETYSISPGASRQSLEPLAKGLRGSAIRKGAFYSPRSRLWQCRVQTTPGFRLGLHEGAASQLYKDGL